jgi:hypothetical protein
MIQVELHCNQRRRITWVEDQPKIKIGNTIQFKGEEFIWNINAVYPRQDRSNINRSWHVGGL